MHYSIDLIVWCLIAFIVHLHVIIPCLCFETVDDLHGAACINTVTVLCIVWQF